MTKQVNDANTRISSHKDNSHAHNATEYMLLNK